MSGEMAGETSRERRVWLSQIREELLAPLNALTGYAEIVQEEAKRLDLKESFLDIERIRTAIGRLADQASRLVVRREFESVADAGERERQEQVLHHELRTPLNAIIGYGEMLLEDLSSAEAASLRADLAKIVESARELLSRLKQIISFPLDDPVSAEPRGPASAPPAVADLLRSFQPNLHSPTHIRTGYILVVDDIEANRDLLSRRLSREGFRVAAAEGGRAALEMVARENFDLILLDLMMPDINGLDVLRQIKTDERLRRIPVIMISAIDETHGAIKCIEAGAEDYLAKPFDPVLLHARINASLDKKRWRDREKQYLTQLEEESRKFERLLHSVLPKPIIIRLKQGETLIADRFDQATVLFSDLVGFTARSAASAPADLVMYLNRLFSEFDALAATLGVEKIKTLGDAYMVVAGVPEPMPGHCAAIVKMGIGMTQVLERVNAELGWSFKIRIGIHSGPVVAGVIGTHRLVYDVWGDTVNFASRLEASSLPNRIHLSETVATQISQAIEVEACGSVDLKGIGLQRTFLIRDSTTAAVLE